MSRYIDTDLLYVDWYDSFVADDGTEHDNIPFISKGQINDAPSIDIVFCEECKKSKICCSNGKFYRWCSPNIKRVKDNDFCSDGKRRKP